MRRTLLLGLAMIAAPALADVKTGVDAWAKGDFKSAVEQWRGPAVAGDSDAQFNLGQAYKLGRGVPVDPGLAESWFRKAALQGHEQAGDNYALALFQSGRKTEALPWLEKSAMRGEPRTQLVLGTMLFNGDGAPRDYPRAYALMTRAAAAGLPSASETLVQMDQYITPTDRERGTKLSQKYAAEAVIRETPPPPSASPTGRRHAWPSQLGATDLGRADAEAQAKPHPTPIAAKPTPKPKPSPVAVAAKPKPAPATRPLPPRKAPGASSPAQTRAGGWSAQLGAFRSRGNAEALWGNLKGKFPGAQALYRNAGGVIRLQAGGYATRAAAQAACKKAGMSCVIVAP